jgi:hexulose-6-phosphate isomerase
MFRGHLLGLYEKALPQEWCWDKRLSAIKKLGFDYMEISIDETDERINRLYWNKEKKKELLDISISHELPVKSMCLSAHRRFPFGSSQPEIREKAYEIMELAIEFADQLGINVIQLAGYDVYYEESTPESVKSFLEGMRWSARLAEKYQVMIAVEIMDTPFMNSISKYLWYEEQIGSLYHKLYPDLGNLTAWGNDVAKELEKGMSSIVAIHLKETKPVTETFKGQFKCVPFGQGSVDFVKAFKILRKNDYCGPFLLEMWTGTTTDAIAEIQRSLAYLDGKYRESLDEG